MMRQDGRILVAGNTMDEIATQKSWSSINRFHGSSSSRIWTRVASSLSMTLIILLQLIAIIAGQSTSTDTDETECVCSPRQFFFKLNLSATCPPLPPPFPPNDVFGSGVKDYTCSIGPEPVQNDAGDLILDGEELVEPSGDESESNNATGVSTESSSPSTRRLGQRRYVQESSNGVGTIHNSTASDYFPEVDLQWSSVNFTTSSLTTEVDVTPVVIYSIQFLEVDTSFNVINQDSAYVRGIDFVSGDVFNYTSVSATRRGVVPGGMNMVLRGVNAKGDPVRNVFTITYTNECGIPTFQEGDAIGWVVFENFEPASEETCGILTTAPSTGSVAKETSPPSKSPSLSSSSKIPTSDGMYYPTMSYSYILYGGKSGKAKSSKKGSSKGGKAKYKSTEGSDGWHHPSNNSHGNGSTRPEPYRALLRDTLLTEIKLDQYDHNRAELRNVKQKHRRQKKHAIVGQEVRR